MTRACSVLVLNYNGRHLLEEYLPSVVEAVAQEGPQHEVVLVDNASADDSIAWVEAHLPSVRIRRMEANERLFSYNRVVAEVDRPYVALLNNDVRVVSRPFLAPLLDHFHDPAVFAVMPAVLSDKPEEVYLHRCPGIFRRGRLLTGRWQELPGPGYTLFAHGGASVYDREKFLLLGGLDRLYWPRTTEEVDLSYRAWARGWTTWFQPMSKVFHQGGATLSLQPGKARDVEKNSLLFGIKNYRDASFLREFLLWSLLRLGKVLATGQIGRAGGYWDALRALPQAWGARQRARQGRRLSDRAILATVRASAPAAGPSGNPTPSPEERKPESPAGPRNLI